MSMLRAVPLVLLAACWTPRLAQNEVQPLTPSRYDHVALHVVGVDGPVPPGVEAQVRATLAARGYGVTPGPAIAASASEWRRGATRPLPDTALVRRAADLGASGVMIVVVERTGRGVAVDSAQPLASVHHLPYSERPYYRYRVSYDIGVHARLVDVATGRAAWLTSRYGSDQYHSAAELVKVAMERLPARGG